ncbi:hypothetical protein [Kribbella italica]|uniref:WD40 repeat domain-containing protein n=1 Tax=Kribbella italica TaxID=1540520 RepID=A0A7W9JEE8_9ACTN|nr:hypothetical protein [Kribbella italica]MBB5839938.1 hypothetical protein [Kribbella italica]
MAAGNTRLVVLVTAVAVAAVAIGGVVATSQGPESDDGPGTASPLAVKTGSAGTPSTEPVYTGPVKVKVPLAKLKVGREPQVAYSVGREIRGGAGGPVVVPGSASVLEFTRMGEEAFAVMSTDQNTSVLLKLKITGDREQVPDVITVRGTEDQSAVAYSTQPRGKDELNAAGSTVYSEDRDGKVEKLVVKDLWSVRVLAYVDGVVYYRASPTDEAVSSKLFAWKPGDAAAKVIPTTGSPTAISRDGKLVALRTAPGEYRACSTVNELATGRSLWRTCDFEIQSFTPDGRTAIATPPYEDGWASSSAAALDASDGTLLRQWSGAFFVSTLAEDDQHVLLLIDDRESMPRGVLRCTITTGACESAIPLGSIRIGLGN